MKPPTLLILAAGVGSRYGGLKQLDPVGPGGAALMDYTIFDAMGAGIWPRGVGDPAGDRVRDPGPYRPGRGETHRSGLYAYQDLDDLPEGMALLADRKKPWGTGQAVLTAAPFLNGPFVAANADDFYGRRAVEALSELILPTPWGPMPPALGHGRLPVG